MGLSDVHAEMLHSFTAEMPFTAVQVQKGFPVSSEEVLCQRCAVNGLSGGRGENL